MVRKIKLTKIKHQDTSKYYQTTLQLPNLINLYLKPKPSHIFQSNIQKKYNKTSLTPNANHENSFLPSKTKMSLWMVLHP